MSDRITVAWAADDDERRLAAHGGRVAGEVLATTFEEGTPSDGWAHDEDRAAVQPAPAPDRPWPVHARAPPAAAAGLVVPSGL